MVGTAGFELRPSGPKPDALARLRYVPTLEMKSESQSIPKCSKVEAEFFDLEEKTQKNAMRYDFYSS